MDTRYQITLTFTDADLRRIAAFLGEPEADLRAEPNKIARFVREEIGQSMRQLADDYPDPDPAKYTLRTAEGGDVNTNSAPTGWLLQAVSQYGRAAAYEHNGQWRALEGDKHDPQGSFADAVREAEEQDRVVTVIGIWKNR